ncbi:MAG: hypothetical protein ACO1QB_05320 [Verrucomicrobiales bacterium]
MRGRAILFVSLGVNLLLAVLIYCLARETAALDSSAASAAAMVRAPEKVLKTNVVVRRLPIAWADLESTDFRKYIQNLRAIGCPERTVRDIIVAEVDDLFAERMRAEMVTPEQQWWRLEPDMDIVEAAFGKHKQLEAEKQLLLTELLGSSWKDPEPQPPMPQTRRLDGPILGMLSKEVREAVAALELQSQERTRSYIETLGNNSPDPAHLARLQEQARQELGQVLTPEQLEEYLLRYSSTAQSLRLAVNGLNTGAEEFRRMFRAMDPYQREIDLLSGDTPAVQKRKTALEEMKNEAIRQAMGTEQFNLYSLSQNPLFRQARAEVEQQGAPPEKALPIYEINLATQAELERIQNDGALSEVERIHAMQAVQAQQQQSIKQVLGSEAE